MTADATADTTADAFCSTVVSNISSMMSSVDSLKEEVQVLKGKLNRDPTILYNCNTCLIYVRCITEPLTNAFLESKLQIETLGFDIIRCKLTSAFRVKIAKSLLFNALTHAHVHDCVADICY